MSMLSTVSPHSPTKCLQRADLIKPAPAEAPGQQGHADEKLAPGRRQVAGYSPRYCQYAGGKAAVRSQLQKIGRALSALAHVLGAAQPAVNASGDERSDGLRLRRIGKPTFSDSCAAGIRQVSDMQVDEEAERRCPVQFDSIDAECARGVLTLATDLRSPTARGWLI